MQTLYDANDLSTLSQVNRVNRAAGATMAVDRREAGAILAHCEWASYWTRTADRCPEWAAACAWNNTMLALDIMAREAVADAR